MAPNLALSTREMIGNMIVSKSQGESTKDDEIARIARCSTRTVRNIRSNLAFGSTRAPTNGAGRPRTITPPMLTALYDRLSDKPSMTLDDMAGFVRKEFGVDVTRYSIRRALQWTKKVAQNVTQEQNPDLRDDYMHEISTFLSDQLVFIDETGVQLCSKLPSSLHVSILILRQGGTPKYISLHPCFLVSGTKGVVIMVLSQRSWQSRVFISISKYGYWVRE